MLVYAAVLLVARCTEGRLLVHAPAGTFRGLPANDGDYDMYLGIPYAKVNASNPFGESIPHEKFDNVFDAFTESAVCPQIKEVYKPNSVDIRYEGTLDCLRLNIFVPKSESKHRAVFIFVFGGRYRNGCNEISIYGPKYLVRHDIIVVTINFRSGPYGFMCMDIPEIPGNQGLRDQYDAIKWVRDNIGAFGGDPERLTLCGHSSGSSLVDMHLLTERPRLFQQAILQSGAATSPGFLGPSNPMTLVNIARKLGFKTNDTYSAMSFLAKASPKAVVKATDIEYNWKPCVEKKFEDVVPFITVHPELSEGLNVDGLKILGGFTDRESLYSLYAFHYRPIFILPDGFRYSLYQHFNLQNRSDLVDVVHRFYLDDYEDRKSYEHKIVDLLSDFNVVYPKHRQLIKYTNHKNTSVYLYIFSYDGDRNRMKKIFNITKAGATHSDELGYMFSMDFMPDTKYRDQCMIDKLTTLWANFVKYGEPTPVTTELLPVRWPPLTGDTVPCLQIDSNLTVLSRPFRRRMAFWDLFFDAHLDKLRIPPT
ncbi:acetylcholinesterase-like [Aricia agestis]|uniref:acetylcholinesterase-like n=1 Tax=Aricia agestis TaxID=91739 RepID=UPI001C20820E|nr:acetylcholinesterase-like [Aricia agestis]